MNPWIILSGCLVWVIGSLIISHAYCDWTWLGRSGAILTLGGAALATRRLLRMGIKAYYEDESTTNGGHFTPPPEDILENQQKKLDVIASGIGFWFIIIGTVIWGYGDLFQRFVSTPTVISCHCKPADIPIAAPCVCKIFPKK